MSSANRTRIVKENPMPRTRVNPVRRVVLALAIAGAAALGVAAPASAADFSPDSSLIGNWTYNGCSITVGPVFDTGHSLTNYRTIGGARVSCATGGHTIAITVSEWYSNGPSQWQWISASSTVRNTSWSMYTTTPYCSGRGYYWRTYAYIVIDGYGTWVWSPWSGIKTTGC